MEIKTRKKLDELKNILEDSNTYAAMVFGSYVKNSDYNDIDVAVFTEKKDLIDIIKEAPGIFDIKKFNELPLYIAHRALEEGEVFYLKDKDKFYDDVFSFIKEWEDFKPRYKEYLEGVKQNG